MSNELTPPEDGYKGVMSLCAHCLKVFTDQVGMDGHALEKIKATGKDET